MPRLRLNCFSQSRPTVACLALLCTATSAAAQEEPGPDDPTVMLDPLVIDGDDAGADYDPTGLDGGEAERKEAPFSNEFLSDPAFDDIPLGELDAELEALAGSRADAAAVAAGSETVDLRGFPAPARRNGFTQTGIPEVINPGGSELVIGSLVPVVGRAAPGGIRNHQVSRPRGKTSRQLETSLGTQGSSR